MNGNHLIELVLYKVVLNVSPTDPMLSLDPNSTYKFTLMAINEDNWVI
jgi:hypothetical protein